ncbi:hypothetical protein [Bacillus thuringiensis]|uniref:Uncharacterized protein n=1 Tax=Bacillus thuringiensis TaxID=1428 RepID=A0AAW9JDM9_BACTU|nr:hypothetical protein [Bacillus thuringiensis]MDZ5476789.1 hypothetical protein [Bacillus thuringiensis]MRB36337.1 hypothetical protein [Bacillus thuringiensis]
MTKIETQPSIEVNENIVERIKHILDVAQQYGLRDVVEEKLEIHSSEEVGGIAYTLDIPKIYFEQYPKFQMKLNEIAYASEDNLSITKLESYLYHGFHLENPKVDFIRFDYEPFKEKYAPVHINAYKKKWGDHLVFPDDTNLDISKMSCPIALQIFNRYARDKDDFPTNQETNQPYVEIIGNGR